MKEQDTGKFSYKLDIQINPWWFKLYGKALGKALGKISEIQLYKERDQISEEIKEKEKKVENIDDNLFGRQYLFTEYYDSSTGLTIRFQRTWFPSGKQVFCSVDEFGDRGYIFDCDSALKNLHEENNEKRAQRNNLVIEIGDSFIRKNIFDEYHGGNPKSKEDHLCEFPLGDIFNFLFALEQRFPFTEKYTIIKWPDSIEKKFQELGISYTTTFNGDLGEPTLFDIEKYDKEIFERWGDVKITSNSSGSSSFRSEKDGTSFNVKLKIFRPGENNRFN